MQREVQTGAEERALSVLIADHSTAVQKNLIALASELCLRVLATTDEGTEAVALSWLHRPDLILFDMGMPGKPGLEALAEIREQSPHSKILVLTSTSERDQVVACKKLGVADYVLKPFQMDQLKFRINRVVWGMGRGTKPGAPVLAGDGGDMTVSFFGRIMTEARQDKVLFFEAQAMLSQADIEEVFHDAAAGR